jgi:sortase (surface protein transpeptidase)
MTGYIILGAFVLLVVSHTAVFFTGYAKARKAAERDRLEEAQRKAESEKQYQQVKDEIKEEVTSNAEKEKAALSAGGTGRERFNRINDSLRK